MKQTIRTCLSHSAMLSAVALTLSGCSDDDKLGQAASALTVSCVDAQAPALPESAWECEEDRTVECNSGTGTADVDTIYVRDGSDSACLGEDLVLSDDGPFPVGVHTITVTKDDGDNTLCSSTLTVTDTQAPVLESKVIALWPPNHKFHSISVSDCVGVTDACDGSLTGEFIWASSDEPVDDKGDGHHAPDILIGDDCNTVQVRSERQGPKDGRVYKLGVRVVDGGGNAVEGSCTIIVDHDQRGVEGADSGESYRITLDGSNGTPVCDGVSDVPEGDDSGDGADDVPAGDGDGSDLPSDGSDLPSDGSDVADTI